MNKELNDIEQLVLKIRSGIFLPPELLRVGCRSGLRLFADLVKVIGNKHQNN